MPLETRYYTLIRYKDGGDTRCHVVGCYEDMQAPHIAPDSKLTKKVSLVVDKRRKKRKGSAKDASFHHSFELTLWWAKQEYSTVCDVLVYSGKRC